MLKRAYEQGELVFPGSLRALADRVLFEQLVSQAVRQDWVVYAKPPFGGPQQVLKYLARYTHRVAISNSRICSFDGQRVSFQWKDYADGERQKIMTLDAGEFVRRFLMHVLPGGFTRIRYFGFLANRHRRQKLETIRRFLSMPIPEAATIPLPLDTMSLGGDETTGEPCPICRSGRVHRVTLLPPTAPAALNWLLPNRSRPWWDTS